MLDITIRKSEMTGEMKRIISLIGKKETVKTTPGMLIEGPLILNILYVSYACSYAYIVSTNGKIFV